MNTYAVTHSQNNCKQLGKQTCSVEGHISSCTRTLIWQSKVIQCIAKQEIMTTMMMIMRFSANGVFEFVALTEYYAFACQTVWKIGHKMCCYYYDNRVYATRTIVVIIIGYSTWNARIENMCSCECLCIWYDTVSCEHFSFGVFFHCSDVTIKIQCLVNKPITKQCRIAQYRNDKGTLKNVTVSVS